MFIGFSGLLESCMESNSPMTENLIKPELSNLTIVYIYLVSVASCLRGPLYLWLFWSPL